MKSFWNPLYVASIRSTLFTIQSLQLIYSCFLSDLIFSSSEKIDFWHSHTHTRIQYSRFTTYASFGLKLFSFYFVYLLLIFRLFWLFWADNYLHLYLFLILLFLYNFFVTRASQTCAHKTYSLILHNGHFGPCVSRPFFGFILYSFHTFSVHMHPYLYTYNQHFGLSLFLHITTHIHTHDTFVELFIIKPILCHSFLVTLCKTTEIKTLVCVNQLANEFLTWFSSWVILVDILQD